MALQILGTGPKPEEVIQKLEACITAALPDARVEVAPGSPGHYEIRVESGAFEGLGRVQQQQKVYAAIAHLMKGPTPPVHAVDRLECATPARSNA